MNNTAFSAVTIGNFDGVHQGHQTLLKKLKTLSCEHALVPMVYTFREHPFHVLKGKGAIQYITNQEEQKAFFSKLGIEKVLYDTFLSVKDLTPEEFVKQILVDKLHAKIVVVGENNRFGKNAQGDAVLLKQLGEKYGFSVYVVESVYVDNVLCSSSNIRMAVKNGDLPLANKLLGRPYAIKNSVITGKKLGRTYGFPTANLVIPENKVTPKDGVYATNVEINHCIYPAITNVGVTSFDKDNIKRIETHIIGFDGDIYGKELNVHFLKYMREMVQYENIHELEKQLLSDREQRLHMREEEK